MLTTGCSSVLPVLEAAGGVASAAGAYWSYKALNREVVNVEVLSKECLFAEYIRVSCDDRVGMSEELKKDISAHNKLLVGICKKDRPEPLVCN